MKLGKVSHSLGSVFWAGRAWSTGTSRLGTVLGASKGRSSWPHAQSGPFPPSGDVSIGIKCAPGVVGPAEADIDFDIIKNDNDTFTVKYTPPGAGHYTIMVLFANQVR